VNGGWRHIIADTLYEIIGLLAGLVHRHLWKRHTQRLVQAVLPVARRDPGCRVLVVLNVRHCHLVRHALRRFPEICVVSYSQLAEEESVS
jgi:hypothetical protein